MRPQFSTKRFPLYSQYVKKDIHLNFSIFGTKVKNGSKAVQGTDYIVPHHLISHMHNFVFWCLDMNFLEQARIGSHAERLFHG